jgi:hypothetical protein
VKGLLSSSLVISKKLDIIFLLLLYVNTFVVLYDVLISDIEFPLANSLLTQVKLVNGYVSVKLKILLDVEFEIKSLTFFSPGKETNGCDLDSLNKF